MNLNFDEKITGWVLQPQSVNAGYTATATSQGCYSGSCAILTRSGEIASNGAGLFNQHIDATPYRGKTIRFHAKMRSALADEESSARIWLRVERAEGKIGFIDTMANRAPKSLPDWTDMDITGKVADDATAITFGALFIGDGTAWIDDVSLQPVP